MMTAHVRCDCYGWPTGARHRIERHLTLGSMRQHASVTVSGLGILLFLSVSTLSFLSYESAGYVVREVTLEYTVLGWTAALLVRFLSYNST